MLESTEVYVYVHIVIRTKIIISYNFLDADMIPFALSRDNFEKQICD